MQPLQQVAHVVEFLGHVAVGAVDVVGAVDRVLDNGADTGLDVVGEPEGLEDGEDIREHHQPVGAVVVPGEHGDLGGNLRVLDRLEKGVLLAQLAVLGDVAAGLAHQPDRWPLRALPTGRADEQVVGSHFPTLGGSPAKGFSSAWRPHPTRPPDSSHRRRLDSHLSPRTEAVAMGQPHILILGPPGAGKGTQSGNIAEEYGIEHVTTGDGFVLDGYPRNLEQAEELSGMTDIDVVLSLEVSREELVDRLSGRRVCDGCGANFHVEFDQPAEEGICDGCGGELEQREDDRPEAVENRLDVFDENTTPVIEQYQDHEGFVAIDGEQPPAEVWGAIDSAVRGRADVSE